MNILLLVRSVLFIHVCGDGGIYILRNMLISPVHMLALQQHLRAWADWWFEERKKTTSPPPPPPPFPLSRRVEVNVTLKDLSEKHMPKYVHNGRPGERNLVSRIMCFCFFGTRLSFNHFWTDETTTHVDSSPLWRQGPYGGGGGTQDRCSAVQLHSKEPRGPVIFDKENGGGGAGVLSKISHLSVCLSVSLSLSRRETVVLVMTYWDSCRVNVVNRAWM